MKGLNFGTPLKEIMNLVLSLENDTGRSWISDLRRVERLTSSTVKEGKSTRKSVRPEEKEELVWWTV